MMRMSSRAFVVTVVVCLSSARAQVGTITEERVRDTVSWLAADERRGRDTGSPELVVVGDWIAGRFEAAGLSQVRDGSWRHEFPLAGWQLDSTAVSVTLTRKQLHDENPVVVTLAPDADVRQWTVGDATSGKDEPCTVAPVDDPVLQQLLRANSARQPVVVEVADDHPYWLQAKGKRSVLGGKRQASRPVFLVRKGVLPPAPAEGEAAWTIGWSTPPAEKVEVPQSNMVACLRGTTKKDEYVLVSAHYDHVGVGPEVDGDRIYNGADDDASGTTAVLLLAEAMAKEPPPARSILFVCFTGEEKGLLGSKAFAAEPPVPLDRIVANLNIEMIGRPESGKEGKAWITGVEYSDFAAIAAPALAAAGVEVVEFAMARQLFMQSDNWSLAQKGVVAHSLSAGSLHRDYHRPSDEVEKLDIPHMTKIIRALHALTLEFANRDGRPSFNDEGKKRLQGRRRG